MASLLHSLHFEIEQYIADSAGGKFFYPKNAARQVRRPAALLVFHPPRF
jgi:hypothetical protein